ncbi:MAG: aminodeoxychorismate synthase component I [Alphaproteobacteria bacterium]|nr:aminodeoxychorismate synthase component I [Alphaproteobacteria bacterium]
MAQPFILLDDAREQGAADARLYRNPVEIIVARRADEVEPALARLHALSAQGLHLAGHLAYEAGLVLEPRLATLANRRTGADGPLLWFGAFTNYETIAPADVPLWLAANSADGPVGIGPLNPSVSPGDYGAAFAAIQEAIRAGEIYQANLTLPLSGTWQGDALALYAAIRPAAKAGNGGVIHDGSHWLLSFSPELFFAIRGRRAMVKPMKGTRPRGRDAQEDEALRADLARSDKDRAENLMIVDLMRNDLSRVAVPGTVRVERPFAVESYPTVHQMVTTITAELPPSTGAVAMLRALFPCGSITGAPKIRAMELIDAVEQWPRGPYCGAIGRIDPDGAGGSAGDAAFNVSIRTLRLSPDRNGPQTGGGLAVLGVGSAIVADSESLPEWRECLVKGAFLRQSASHMTASRFDLIETMAFAPETGVALLELHLERIKASAAELGFAFDRHAARNAIHALCFDAGDPAKLRLSLARSGATTLELSGMPLVEKEPLVCAAMRLPVDASDWRLRHKTSDRWFYEAGLEAAREAGAGEALFVREDGLVTEGCYNSVFVERDGVLLTPPARLGLLPGVLRRSLLDEGRACEAELTLSDLAGGFLVGNALRGLRKAELLR